MIDTQVLKDIRELPATALRAKYPLEYNSWRNTKSRRHKGAVIAPEFERFADFLLHVGPAPRPNLTLDRIDNNNPTYGPGLVRWLDKVGQANNRSSTVHLTINGQTRPVQEWAHMTGTSAKTIHSRLRRGWSSESAVFGSKRAPPAPGFNPYASNPWPLLWPDEPERQDYWEHAYTLGYPYPYPRIAFFEMEGSALRDRWRSELDSWDIEPGQYEMPERTFLREELEELDRSLKAASRLGHQTSNALLREKRRSGKFPPFSDRGSYLPEWVHNCG